MNRKEIIEESLKIFHVDSLSELEHDRQIVFHLNGAQCSLQWVGIREGKISTSEKNQLMALVNSEHAYYSPNRVTVYSS